MPGWAVQTVMSATGCLKAVAGGGPLVSCAPEADVISRPANGWSLLMNPVYLAAPPIKPTSGRPSSFRFWELLARK
jgi:hypothetical protein